MSPTPNPPQASDTASSHITPAGGNVFTDLGFGAERAQALLEQADASIREEAETNRILAELLESAADMHTHGVVDAQALRELLDTLSDIDLRAKVLARLPERARAVFVDLEDL